MKLRHLLVANSLVVFIFGIAFAAWGPKMLPLYGVDYPGAATVWSGGAFARTCGVVLFCIGAVLWVARNVHVSKTQRALALTLLSANSIGFLVASALQIAVWETAMGNVTVILLLVFSLCYVYTLFAPMKRRETEESLA